ncbi:hypothetical protein ANCCEY_13837 [Ancylostoma ceylanicum]|uniref:Pecanex-like protein n=1 Tax=Ancylostoma ceylanicum TaxID=53326 RepID=A0A0D6LB91_9BILA|nr:hypothetical protein ANCCEY_13837 [Ancylostoma ceylanicum]
MSSAEEFQTGALKARVAKKDAVVGPLTEAGVSDVKAVSLSSSSKSVDSRQAHESDGGEVEEKDSVEVHCEEMDQPSTSKGICEAENPYAVVSAEDTGPKRRRPKITKVVDDSPPSTSGWYPVVVSLGDTDRRRSTSISKAPEERAGGADIKVEITKFLEELIEKHPETLDVIENVRQSRLGRSSASHRVPQMLRLHGFVQFAKNQISAVFLQFFLFPLVSSTRMFRVPTRRRSSSSSVAALSDMALRDGTHVAAGHEDTSQGAVHSFQDADGMWWTYAFDEHAAVSVDYSAPPTRRTSTVKKSYYYKMKMFPKTNKSFKLKLDRLSVSALFDRNRSAWSCAFDVLLACTVSFLAGLVLATGIYFDIWLFLLAFTVAGAHFSLLKSVQPDASSPIHGFNWLVAYSRPVYFCIGAVIVLVLHHFADDPNYDKIPWNWNPYRLYETSGEMVLLAFRDLFATFLVMLPFAFTMGWLPQVSSGLFGGLHNYSDTGIFCIFGRGRRDLILAQQVIIIPICVAFGIMNHYLYEQLRTHTPWKLIAKPILHSREYTQYESPDEAKLMNFEIIHVWMLALEKNLPFSIPHSALIWTQTVVSSLISAPLNPFLASQIDRGPMLDDSNLNAVFYEHLTRSLQKSLAGDLLMGRWATSVQPGDCFILASFYLNCLVHIIEVGNGFVTFQLRGLEFRGTYCHQREVVTGKYIIDGYSITDNSAVNLLQVHELRRLLVTLYVKCIVYYALASNKLQSWLANETVVSFCRVHWNTQSCKSLESC